MSSTGSNKGFIHSHTGNKAGTTFRLTNGQQLTKADVLVKHCRPWDSLGPSQFAGHSFHIRAATAAASTGIDESMIRTLQ